MKNRNQNVMRFNSRILPITLLFLAVLAASPRHARAQTAQASDEECVKIKNEILNEIDDLENINARRGILTFRIALSSEQGDKDRLGAERDRETQNSKLSRNKIRRLLDLLDECRCPKGTGKPEETSGTPAEKPRRNEVAGGFSLIREDSDPENFNTYGFHASYTRYLNETVGLTGDFSANFRERGGVDLTKTSYTGGVTVFPFAPANGDDRVRVFARGLFGVSHLKADIGTASFTDNAFAAHLTGGVDIDVSGPLFVRPIEAGVAPTRFNGEWQANRVYRFSFGFRF